MSNIGKIPIKIPENVELELTTGVIKVKGPKGEMEKSIPSGIVVSQKNNYLRIKRSSDSQKLRELHGLTRSLIFNMIEGVVSGYEKKLKMVGVGFRAALQDDKLILNIGFSHPMEIETPPGVEFKVEKNTLITVSGIDKELVGRVASGIRTLKKPEPYKGKGIMYEGEKIRRKAGKTLKTGPEA